MHEKKLLFISNRMFWPPMSGHEVEVYNYCRGLEDKYGYSIDIYAFDDESKLNNNPKPSFLNNIYMSKPIKKPVILMNLLFKSLFKEWPLQNSLYYSRENEKEVSELLKKNNYDAVIVDMVRLASYYNALSDTDCKKILNIEDVLSKRYKRQLKAVTQKTVIAGNYNEKLPLFIQKILCSSFIKKAVLRIEIPRMEKAEKHYSELYDKVIFVSAVETEEFNKKYNTDKAVTISLGVDYPFFSENISVTKAEDSVVFIGNMATPANADSVIYIIDNVLPECKNVKSAIFVGNCPRQLITDYSDNKKVVFTGKVNDFRVNVKEGTVFLAPLVYGTGIKTKILEAMAMGMPVVTNSIGAEGIPGEHGVHWYVSDDPKEIASYVDLLLSSQELCEQIGKNAQKLIENHFQWDIIFDHFSKLDL